ncbi:MAG: CarD family transcriptional regulator [Defluviitaleaceae bacterium]|nr:CarD family transcriptional regulator [Defluviitaleaceae bacterium]
MYKKGDKIVYPMYGAGIIEDVEEKEVDGELQSYYVLNIPVGNLKIMISTAKAEQHSVRPVLPWEEIKLAMNTISDKVDMQENWNQRYKENMKRIKSGDLAQVSTVFRSLLEKERGKGLSTAEKKLMTTARQIILSEVVLSLDISKDDGEEILESSF